MRNSILFILLFTMSLFFAAGLQAEQAEKEGTGVGFSVQNMDRTTDPRNNFTRYAIGGWLDRKEIPDDKIQITAANALQDNLDSQLLAIARSSAAASQDTHKASQDTHDYLCLKVWLS